MQSQNKILITGPHGSGTTYLGELLHCYTNSIILQEPKLNFKHDNPEDVEGVFHSWKECVIKRDLPPYGKVFSEPKYKINTSERILKRLGAFRYMNERFILGIKHPKFMTLIPRMRNHLKKIRCIAIMRDPLNNIGSWIKRSHGNVPKPVAYLFEKESHIQLVNIVCNHKDKITQMTCLWKLYSDLILENLDIFELVKYHEVVKDPEGFLNNFYSTMDNCGEQMYDICVSKPANSKHVLTEEEIDIITKICKPNAVKLGVWID